MTAFPRLRLPFLHLPFLLFCLSAFLPMTTGCVVTGQGGGLVERDEKTFAVNGKPDLTLSTFDGSIEVRSWDRSDVLVVVEKRAWDRGALSAIEVRAEQNGSRVEVAARRSPWFGWAGSLSARLIVSVPATADVRAMSGDGSIDIERISGAVDLRSGDGSIRGSQLVGDVRAMTGDGSISLERVEGTIEVHTGDGGIRAEGELSGVRARSGDGSIVVRAASGSSPDADWEIVTGDGSITLELPGGFDADIAAHTGDGGIRAEGIALSNVTGPMNRNTLRGRLGKGGREVRVRTGDGSITLRQF
jgi:hypothetical protein